MRAIIQDQVSHKFFEGPIPSNTLNGNAREESRENTAWHTTQDQGPKAKENGMGNDADIAWHETNEKYE
jgi:hypothetical protein